MKIIDSEPTRESRNRSVEFTWDLQDLGDNTLEQLVLSASHDGDRKCFRATLRQQTRETRPGGFSAVGFKLFSGVTLLREPVARFNQKRLDEFADAALALLRSTDDENVAALLTPSDRSCGCKGTYHAAGCEVYAAIARARSSA